MTSQPPVLMSRESAPQRELFWWLFAGGLAGLAALWLLHAWSGQPFLAWPPCWFHALTSWHCPGCGTTRAALACWRGEFGAAVGHNPLLVLALPTLGLLILLGRGGRPPRWRPVWIWTGAVVVVGFTVLRNLPTTPFVWLAP